MGHQVVCLITMHPLADDSPLFHYPNSWVAKYTADALQVPLLEFPVDGKSKEVEMKLLEGAILQARSRHNIEGIVYGGISSKYQMLAFEEICTRHGLSAIAPIWNYEPLKYMNELVEHHFHVIIVGVSAMGLGKEWLGREIDKDSLLELAFLSKKYGFNLTFEGGEAETLVTDCPLFSKKLLIKRAKTHWDGQRGIFEILEVALAAK